MAANEPHFWDTRARKYAASPIADMDGYERTISETRQRLKPTDTVLEFGCGTASTALKLAPAVARYVATDFSSGMLDVAREKAAAEGVGNIEFAVAAPEAAPWSEASFDAVLAFNLWHLVAKRDVALRSVHRLLKPGGLFISKTPCIGEMNPGLRLAIPLMQLVGQAPHVDVFSAETLEREIAAAGFTILERARHGTRKKQEPRIYIVAQKA